CKTDSAVKCVRLAGARWGTRRFKRIRMRRSAAAILLACFCAPAAASAQTYPTRPITITVTAAAGGATDVGARALGQRLSETSGQQVVIENKGGAAHV